MDTNTVLVIVIVILAVIVIIAFLLFRTKTKVDVKGPFGTGVAVDASNEPAPPTPAVKAEGIKSRQGGMTATDETGRGVDAKDVDVDKDVMLKSTPPPKVPPPA